MEVSTKDVTTALVHLYRGELGRMTSYRTRLDATTNWAVGTTAAMVSFALGNRDVPHFVAIFALALDLVFLVMESRRYQFYELVRHRVRLLERGFYGAVLGEEAPGWERELRDSLAHPRPAVSLLQAMSHRLRRNYLWLIVVVYAGWFVKLEIHSDEALRVAARIGSVPGTLVLSGALALLAGLAATANVWRPEEPE